MFLAAKKELVFGIMNEYQFSAIVLAVLGGFALWRIGKQLGWF